MSICDELVECLGPYFDAITAQLTALQTTVDEVQQTQEENAATAPGPIVNAVENAICGGATYVVKAMNDRNMRIYHEAEIGAVDELFEMIPLVIRDIPGIGALPFDEMFELVNSYFENQVIDYEADYLAIEDQMICLLKCFIEANDNTFDINTWGDWLTYIGEQYPDNRAVRVFSAFAPARQTFLNQIAQVLFGQQSLQEYFDELFEQYYAGTQDPVACVSCDCPEEWEHTFDFEISDHEFTAPYGTYEPGIGWVSGEIEATLFYTAISISRAVDTSIRYFRAIYDMSGVTGEPQTDRIFVDSDISDNWLDTATNADGTGRQLEWEGDDRDITAFGFTAAASACVGAFCGGEVVVKSITLRGFGTNPFV